MSENLGESLIFSWLKHVKHCQIIQSNWTYIPSLIDLEKDSRIIELKELKKKVEDYFANDFKNEESELIKNSFKNCKNFNGEFNVFSKKLDLKQLIIQGEVDLLGVKMNDILCDYYAVEVAYHQSGLGYGGKKENAMRVVKKLFRAAVYLNLYFNTKKGNVIFVTPNVKNGDIDFVKKCIDKLEYLMEDNGYSFSVKLYSNEDFRNNILMEVIEKTKGIKSSSENFIRAYKMFKNYLNP